MNNYTYLEETGIVGMAVLYAVLISASLLVATWVAVSVDVNLIDEAVIITIFILIGSVPLTVCILELMRRSIAKMLGARDGIDFVEAALYYMDSKNIYDIDGEILAFNDDTILYIIDKINVNDLKKFHKETILGKFSGYQFQYIVKNDFKLGGEGFEEASNFVDTTRMVFFHLGDVYDAVYKCKRTNHALKSLES